MFFLFKKDKKTDGAPRNKIVETKKLAFIKKEIMEAKTGQIKSNIKDVFFFISTLFNILYFYFTRENDLELFTLKMFEEFYLSQSFNGLSSSLIWTA